jgi:large repetitive protein
VGEAVVLEGRASSDPKRRNVYYYWDFGDDKFGTGPTATHKYAAPGTYTMILLIVDEEDGWRMRYAAPVVITAPPSRR